MKILLTGFDPFDREKVNPAFEAVKLLPGTIAGAQIVKLEVPTQFVRAGEVLEAAMAEHKPDVVICVGQAGGRAAITPEKVAINLMDGRIPDNAGYQPVDVPIRADGPAAYFATLPVKAMVQRMQDAGHPRRRVLHCGHLCVQFTDVHAAFPYRPEISRRAGRVHSCALRHGAGRQQAAWHPQHGFTTNLPRAGKGRGSRGNMRPRHRRAHGHDPLIMAAQGGQSHGCIPAKGR